MDLVSEIAGGNVHAMRRTPLCVSRASQNPVGVHDDIVA
jgi:hypothetical protein